MPSVVKELRSVIKNHKYRSQLVSKLETAFKTEVETKDALVSLLDFVSETHDQDKRRDGSLLKSHEYAMLAIALVFCGIRDKAILVAILLHDMHEDYPEIWTPDFIAEKYGVEVAMIVHAVTKPDRAHFATDKEHDEAIFAKVWAGGYQAMVVKCIDRLHNMLTLYGQHDKKVRKVFQTIEYVLPISAACGVLTYELLAVTAAQMARLGLQKAPAH